MTGLFLWSNSSASGPQLQSTKSKFNGSINPTPNNDRSFSLRTFNVSLLAISNDVTPVCTRKRFSHLTSANACDIVAYNFNEKNPWMQK